MHKSSVMRMNYFKENFLDPNEELKILDVGSFDKVGDYNYGRLLDEKKWSYQGLDLKPGNNVDIVVKDAYDWSEIEENTYDVVISGQTLEHIEFFWLTMEQISRVLKPGGLCCIIVPSKGPVHRNPYDCYRFNEDGVRSLAKYVNFDILDAGTTAKEVAKPWYDSYVIARKPSGEEVKNELENRMDDLEHKMDLILEKLG